MATEPRTPDTSKRPTSPPAGVPPLEREVPVPAAPARADKVVDRMAQPSTTVLPSGPDLRVKITETYAGLVARDSYFWAWPLINVYNRRLALAKVPEVMRIGPLPSAPVNRLAMLTDYVDPE